MTQKGSNGSILYAYFWRIKWYEFKQLRVKFLTNYHPAGRHYFYSKYRNGITLRCGRLAVHVWNVPSELLQKRTSE